MPFFNPAQTAVDELKMRIETLEREYRNTKRDAQRHREDARAADKDAAIIRTRIEQYQALIPQD